MPEKKLIWELCAGSAKISALTFVLDREHNIN
jgi:hypothetical protein